MEDTKDKQAYCANRMCEKGKNRFPAPVQNKGEFCSPKCKQEKLERSPFYY